MFITVLVFSYSHIFPNPVIHLTDRNFKRIVDERQNNSVVFVMFHGERCPACRAAYPKFISAAKKMDGIVKFGHVVCSQSQKLAARFRIYSIPTFLIFHADGISSYDSFWRTESGMIKSVLKFVPDLSANVSLEWLENNKNAAVLITNKKEAPKLWCAVSVKYNGNDNIKIGVINDKTVLKELGINETKEKIVFFKNSKLFGEYKGKMNYNDIINQIETVFSSKEL